MNMDKLLFTALLLAIFFGFYGNWKARNLQTLFDLEVVAHAQTRAALEQAVQEGQRWATAAQATLEAAEAQQTVAEACLQREAEAQTDADARNAIMAQAKPRPQPEKDKVVDDETRTRVADRLNRPL